MSNKSMTDIAYEFIKTKKEVPFSAIWSEVCIKLGFNQQVAERKIATFYSALMLDARFIALPDNKWDLRKNYKFSEVHVDTSKLLIDDSELDEDTDLLDFDDEFSEDEEKSSDDDQE
jgi:DNA-directed RNA polymerase subunit delta